MKKEDKKGELVHQHPDVKSDKPKPGTPMKFKNRLWVVKTIKANRALLRLRIPGVGGKKIVCVMKEGRTPMSKKNINTY